MTDDLLRIRSRLLGWSVTGVFVLLLLAAVLEMTVAPSTAADRERLLIYRLPLPFYLWAIWRVRGAISAVGRGDLFGHVVPQLLTHVGIALFLGGIVNVFVSPNLLKLLTESGGYVAYDVAAVTLGVVGLSLIVVAQLLRQAAAMRAELDEML